MCYGKKESVEVLTPLVKMQSYNRSLGLWTSTARTTVLRIQGQPSLTFVQQRKRNSAFYS